MPHPKDEDDELMLATANGDAVAFNRIVQRHAPGLHALVTHRLGNTSDADDIVQEAMWRAWRNADKWQPGRARLGTWLFRVAVNLMIDRYRKNKNRAEQGLDQMPDTASDTVSAERALSDRQQLNRLETALAELPERQQTAIHLSARQEMSNAEIAEILETTEGAVEQLLVRARRRLRDEFRRMQ